MKVLLYGRFGQVPPELFDLVSKTKLEIVTQKPEVIITFGGDGTLLGSEAIYPGIPKLPLKNSEHCHLCYANPNQELLQLLENKQLITKKFLKLQTMVGTRTIHAFSDIVIAHKYPNHAIRFVLPQHQPHTYIGDGLLFSTPFGSTGYFYSITRSSFKQGLGMALNNIHNSEDKQKIFTPEEKILIQIVRGPAVLAWDNHPDILDLSEGQEIIIQKSHQSALILAPLPLSRVDSTKSKG